jgi:hypothetical protein
MASVRIVFMDGLLLMACYCSTWFLSSFDGFFAGLVLSRETKR